MADPVAQNGLSKDAGFLGRLAGLMAEIGKEKLDANANDAYAKKVLNDPFGSAQKAALYVLQTDNFVAQPIVVSFGGSGIIATIATTDADARSQISTVWSTLAALFG
jgi:hypothetical protein